MQKTKKEKERTEEILGIPFVSHLYRGRRGASPRSLVGWGLLRSEYADSGVNLSMPPIRASGAVVAG